MTKKKWKEWAAKYVKDTGMCPGDVPSFGLPTDAMTEDEFKLSITSIKKHRYDGCHFHEEMLGVAEATKEMKEIIVDEGEYKHKLDDLKDDVNEVQNSKRLAKLRENLHLYVDRIHFKKNGSLSVPEPLLNIKNYISKFFSSEND